MSRKPNLFAARNARPRDLKPPRKTAASDVHCYARLLNRDNNVSLFRHNLLTIAIWLSRGSTTESVAPYKSSFTNRLGQISNGGSHLLQSKCEINIRSSGLQRLPPGFFPFAAFPSIRSALSAANG